jgi:hypothetical protein
LNKACTKCLIVKRLDEFGVAKNTKDGRKSRCKTCLAEQSRKYNVENSEKRRESERNWRLQNPDKVKAQAKRSRERNKDGYKRRLETWKDANPERYKAGKRANTQNRRALAKSLLIEYNASESSFIRVLYDGCALSNEVNELHDDHFIALSTGHGGTYLANMIPLSSELNLSKSNRNPFEWINEVGDKINYEKLANTVVMLAYLNELTVKEYIDFVYWCYDNPRSIESITDDNRDSLSYWRRNVAR